MGLSVTSAPAAEPLTLSEVKEHLRVDDSTEDVHITALIPAARAWVEATTGRQLVKATYSWTLDGFPDKDATALRLPRAPAFSLDSINYIDTDGASQTWGSSNYQSDLNVDPAIILPVNGQSWPDTQDDTLAAVTVAFKAGYDDDGNSPPDHAANVPQALKQAMLMLIAHWYENRASVMADMDANEVPQAVHFLVSPYKVWWF